MFQVLSALKWKIQAWRFRFRRERQQARFLLSHLRLGEVVVEIGAYQGACTYWLSQAVGPAGKVYAIESQTDLARDLRDLLASRRTNVTVENLDLHGGSMTLDEYFPTGKGPRIDLIRCDNGGNELEILRGGRRLLLQQRPRLLLGLGRQHRGDEEADKIFRFLVSLGYQGYFFAAAGLEDICRFDASIHHFDRADPDYVANFVFLPAAGARRAAA